MTKRHRLSLVFILPLTLVGTVVPTAAQQQSPVFGPQRSQSTGNVKQAKETKPARQADARQGTLEPQQSPQAQRATTQPMPAKQNLLVRTAPFRLSAVEQKRVDQILEYWESRSEKVQTYSARFTRWEYDPVFGPKNPLHARTKGEGIIRYGSPDKGEFKLETLGDFTPPQKAGAPPQYPQAKVEFDEHWICDGKSIYELNSKQKQLVETKLPEDMQGKQIADGPLPFMFGATKAKLNARYWIREIKPPADRKGQYWLEVFPKRPDDAVNFSRVMVILDEKHFLPMAVQIYSPNYDARKNWARTVYQFTDRQVNNPIHRGRKFIDRFISPKPPLGWKKVVANFGQPVGQPPRATASKASNPAKSSR